MDKASFRKNWKNYLHFQQMTDLLKRKKQEEHVDTVIAQAAAFRISGSHVDWADPFTAAIAFMNVHFNGWQKFTAEEPLFPTILAKISYSIKDGNFTNQVKLELAEQKAYYAVANAFKDFASNKLRPIQIHSLRGKIHNEGTSEGFAAFEGAINAAANATSASPRCDKLYFISQQNKKKATPERTAIIKHFEIADILLFGNTGIAVCEVKETEGKNAEHLTRSIQNAMEQLNADEAWLRNCWTVPVHHLSSNDSMPLVHHCVLLPNCPREKTIDVCAKDSKIQVLCKEDIEDIR